jgi:hypothetical protein
MPTMVFTYSPKPGVPFEEFERFLREVDQPVTLSVPSAISSRILRVQTADTGFACIETLEVTSFEEWDRDSKLPRVQAVVAQWGSYGDVANVKAYRCEQFYAGKA